MNPEEALEVLKERARTQHSTAVSMLARGYDQVIEMCNQEIIRLQNLCKDNNVDPTHPNILKAKAEQKPPNRAARRQAAKKDPPIKVVKKV